MKVHIRQYEVRDKNSVYTLHVNGLQESDSYIEDTETRKLLDKDFDDIQSYYIASGGEFLVAIVNDEIVGMGAIRKIGNATAEIKRMRVKREFQGNGIGSLILDRLIVIAKESGIKNLILDTALKQTIAQKLYKSRAFSEYKKDKVFGQETIFYRLQL